ncbi:MAG: hypothetical protein IK125_01945 [Lachnospiraceae bacterium]|nr:hypothetical protein [Lachnospiraceae bacterium]
MGLFSKLFGAKVEKDAMDALKTFTQAAVDAQKTQNTQNTPSAQSAPSVNSAPAAAQAYDDEEDGPSGFSWGPKMPAEENQYNFSGTFEQYFDSIFLKEYPQYRVEKEKVGMTLVYTFYNGDCKALVVEILSRTSGAQKRRNDCRKNGVAYLRYYHNYHGWWNVKQYVIQRTNKALGI